VTDALLAQVENQPLAAGAAGAEALRRRCIVGEEVVAMVVDVGFIHDRKATEIAQIMHAAGVETAVRADLAVVRHMFGGMQQQGAQTLQLQRFETLAWPPLGLLQPPVQRDAIVMLEPLMQRKQQRRDQRGVA
jgi:hypothetical protein